MKTYTVRFYRSLSEDRDAAALPLAMPTTRPRFVAQLRREIEETSTHGIGHPRSAFASVSLAWHRMARNGDAYGILARIETRLSPARLRAALQGLYDRGMAGRFIVDALSL